MGLNIGIVGLPNVGKSTTFNALSKSMKAVSANYAFCTIEPNKAIVDVEDERIKLISKIVKPEKIIKANIEFVDIAGLVKGASKGEGLGNKFLANIRESDVILHILRCFEDDDINHTEGFVDVLRDEQIIQTELLLADLESVEKKIVKTKKNAKFNKEAQKELDVLEALLKHINDGLSINEFTNKCEVFKKLDKELRFLTNKDIVYGANVDEEGLSEDNEQVKRLKIMAKEKNCEVIKICAKIEEELVSLNEVERAEFLNELGIESSGLETIIKTCYEKLGLISYFTAGVKEVRAWTINKGYLAPQAAGVIHNDFAKGFIKAEVISYEDFIKYEGEAKAKENGKLRIEGKEYEVQDGDVMHFRFNV